MVAWPRRAAEDLLIGQRLTERLHKCRSCRVDSGENDFLAVRHRVAPFALHVLKRSLRLTTPSLD